MGKMLPLFLMGLAAAGVAGAVVAVSIGPGEPGPRDGGDVARLRAEVRELRQELGTIRELVQDPGRGTGRRVSGNRVTPIPPARRVGGRDGRRDAVARAR